MKCKFCDSPEELQWPENWKKGDRPINSETNQPHECQTVDKSTKWKENLPIGFMFCGYDQCPTCKSMGLLN